MSRRNQRCGSRLDTCEGNALFSGIGEHSRRCASARETLGRFGLLAFVQKAGERDSATPGTDTSHETMSRTPIFKRRQMYVFVISMCIYLSLVKRCEAMRRGSVRSDAERSGEYGAER